jgi:class 3 adenylate cyclase
MLRERGRLTYGALKRQFNLDDAYLEDLKNELIYGQQLARDEDGKVLVWMGNTMSLATSTALSSALADVTQVPHPHANQTHPIDTSSLHVERRQLTVMFCDLVDSTQLSSQLDPEDLREVIRAYQQASVAVIERFAGHVAQFLGDGLLVYFGYPQAHEDDARRARHAGLQIVEALQTWNSHLERDKGLRLAARVGIHTGLVVIGEMGGGSKYEHLAMGETPNLAARL